MNLQAQNNYSKNRERPQAAIFILLFCALLPSTALFSSCVTIQSSSEEPYYVTEYTSENKTEIYTETVPVIRSISHEELNPAICYLEQSPTSLQQIQIDMVLWL